MWRYHKNLFHVSNQQKRKRGIDSTIVCKCFSKFFSTFPGLTNWNSPTTKKKKRSKRTKNIGNSKLIKRTHSRDGTESGELLYFMKYFLGDPNVDCLVFE